MPAKVPNLLINGASGIAVGMATNMPPHNLKEVADATIHLIDNPEASVNDLMQYVRGPDFPTGGIISGKTGIINAFTTGRGKVLVKAKASVEDNKIIVSEIPYMVNKSGLLQEIAGLVRDGRIKGISDLRDESDREGMRIVIKTKKDASPDIVLNQLYKHTRLKTTFGIDVFSKPFPINKKWDTYKKGSIRLLVYRTDMNHDDQLKVISQFIRVRINTWTYGNRSEDKDYTEEYKKFCESVTLPDIYISIMNNSSFCRHFWSEEEIAANSKKWKD